MCIPSPQAEKHVSPTRISRRAPVRRLRTRQEAPRSPCRDLRARVETELCQDCAHVLFGRALADHKSDCNLAVAMSARDQRRHFVLAWAQQFSLVGTARGRETDVPGPVEPERF